jgi:hypothetical protein
MGRESGGPGLGDNVEGCLLWEGEVAIRHPYAKVSESVHLTQRFH